MRISLLIAFFIGGLTYESIAQSEIINKYFVKEECTISGDKGNSKSGKIPIKSVKKGEIAFSFKESFSDSVLIYINGQLYNKYFVQTDDTMVLGTSNVAFKLTNVKKKTRVVVILPLKKVYTSFSVRRNYKLIKIFRMHSKWIINKSNFVPQYQ